MLAELTAVATDHDDRRQGLLEPASLQRRTADTNSAAAALGKHLQAAVLMQHLQLPAVQAEKPVPVSMLGTNNADDISRQSGVADKGCLHVYDTCVSCTHNSCVPPKGTWPLANTWVLSLHQADSLSLALLWTADTAKADLIGNAQHIMGITPQSLRHLHLPSRKASQVTRQHICKGLCKLAFLCQAPCLSCVG